ncbi:NUDIX domain-containing protein [Candidatus Pacearchaeota archaeon]|nr:NUDIX domain-containing protein [Candidatus Pacearchaeota archaeon]
MKKLDDFNVIVLGIIFDPKRKKILIGRRGDDPFVKKLKWTPPGGRVAHGEDLEISLKIKIKEQTGLEVANLGHIFSMIPKEKKNFVLILHLCEVVKGKERVGGNLKEIKWVNPEELDDYFDIAYHPHLREYILNLK